MDISVIICTYNRAESLRRTLQTCCDLVIPEGVTWELLVVDNNSTDTTKQVCEEFTGKLPLRYLFEPNQGKSNALNTAIAATESNLLLLTDDDVDIQSRWIASMYDAALRYPDVSFFGGPTLPRWEIQPPQWLNTHSGTLLSPVTIHNDKGASELFVSVETGLFFGANIAFRKSAFSQLPWFREDLGPLGSGVARYGATTVTGEETEFMERLILSGHRGLYVPAAVVYHRNSRERMTEQYVRKWYFQCGIKGVRFSEVRVERNLWFGTPRYLWRQLLSSSTRYLISRFVCPSDIWLRAEMRMASAWGSICEYRRLARAAKSKAKRT